MIGNSFGNRKNLDLSNIINVETLPPVVRIRRYPSRKMKLIDLPYAYCSTGRRSSAYVNLIQIEQLIKGGRTIEVRSYVHDRDETTQVLTSLLLEKYQNAMKQESADSLTERVRGLL